MKRPILPILLCLLLVVLAGCSGVLMNAEYSQLLDETAALSAETATRAEVGRLDANEMAAALRHQADLWRKFQDARDGSTGSPQVGSTGSPQVGTASSSRSGQESNR